MNYINTIVMVILCSVCCACSSKAPNYKYHTANYSKKAQQALRITNKLLIVTPSKYQLSEYDPSKEIVEESASKKELAQAIALEMANIIAYNIQETEPEFNPQQFAALRLKYAGYTTQ